VPHYDLDTLNLAPTEVLESKEWETHFKPMLESDLADDASTASRVASTLHSAVSCDVTVFYGESDTSFTERAAQEWRLVQKVCNSDTSSKANDGVDSSKSRTPASASHSAITAAAAAAAATPTSSEASFSAASGASSIDIDKAHQVKSRASPLFRVQSFPDGHGFLSTHSDEIFDSILSLMGRHQPPGKKSFNIFPLVLPF
jgi:surfactin synthase thioesterase subunit